MVSAKRCNNIESINDNFLWLYDSLNFLNIETQIVAHMHSLFWVCFFFNRQPGFFLTDNGIAVDFNFFFTVIKIKRFVYDICEMLLLSFEMYRLKLNENKTPT